MNENPYYSYSIDALSFVERAKAQLATFDKEENISSLLYAALELRMGIEATLHEKLDAVHKAAGKAYDSQKEQAASKLRRKLTSIDPTACDEARIEMTLHPSLSSHTMVYTPPTKELAEMQGKLGDLLHMQIFLSTEYWYLRKPLAEAHDVSLAKHRSFLNSVVEELIKCNSGDLILPPRFKTRRK
ncbi:MAG: hypothetical protein KGJ40_07500 [candidate division NC10 bacterium]|nr:hypothetical protein [candidate division NC10 bacterium]